MSNLTEDRLTALEMKITDQDETLQDLSEMVNSQWKEIEKLRAKLTTAHARINSLEDSLPTGSSAERPPHY
ncbi:hypothetical protein A9Q83_12680 [Alphaproteobacteria bacterium 46_93_T64]|nr:hypothetical protein A9Q83_12680 [Alphaproteobacteria bacterium 46_93_T64]